MNKFSNLYFMQQALTLAKRGKLSVSPNPMVGCIIVKNGQIVGEGWHKKNGKAHAEVNALLQAKDLAKGADVYVTLEPCCHTGKTPPCADALIKAKIAKVIIACLDSNPIVSGNGVKKLRENGIPVQMGLLEKEAKQLNKIFFHYQQNKLPYVFAKWAMSLDGKIAVNKNDSKQISGEKAKLYTHQLRNICDAILIGKNTVLEDNPNLDVRFNFEYVKNPHKFILFSKLEKLSLDLNVFKNSNITLVCNNADNSILNFYKKNNIDIWIINNIKNTNDLDLKQLLIKMASNNISSLLVEGGKITLNKFFNQNVVNEVVTYVSNVVISELESKQKLNNISFDKYNNDLILQAIPIKGDNDV